MDQSIKNKVKTDGMENKTIFPTKKQNKKCGKECGGLKKREANGSEGEI